MAANTDSSTRRSAGSHRAVDRRRADDRPARAHARDPDRESIVPGASRPPRTRTGSGSATSSATSSTRPMPPSSRRCAASTSPPAARSPASGPRPTATRSTARGSAAGRRSSWTRGDPPDRARGARRRSRTSDARSPEPRGSATTRRPTGVARRRTPQHAAHEGRARRAGARGHRAGDGRGAALLRRPAEGRLRSPRRSRSTRNATHRSPTTTRPRPTGRATGHLLRQRLRPALAQVQQARLDDLSRGRARPPLPDRARDGEPGPDHVPAARRRGSSAAPTSRAGACTASGSPTRWACSATRPSGSGCSTRQAWRAARLVVDTGHPRPALGRASARSTSSAAPGCRRPTRLSRPPLHLLAGPGPDLHARPARDRAAPPRDRGPRRLALRPARVPRRRCSDTARCRWRRWRASCRPGWPTPA